MRRQLGITAVFLIALAQPAFAQSGTLLSAQGSAIFQGLGGDPYVGFSGGLGLEGQLRMNFINGRSLGAGVQFSRHGYEEGYGYDAPLQLLGLFIEPRVLLNQSGTRSAPYVSLRLALLSQSTSVEGNSVSATGIQINGGGGILVVANARTNIDVGGTIGAVKFGNYSTGESAGSGMNFVLRVGVSLALGQ